MHLHVLFGLSPVVCVYICPFMHPYDSDRAAVLGSIEIFIGIVGEIKTDARLGTRLTEHAHDCIHVVFFAYGDGLAYGAFARKQLCCQFLAHNTLPVCAQHQCSLHRFKRIDLREAGVYADSLGIEGLAVVRDDG